MLDLFPNTKCSVAVKRLTTVPVGFIRVVDPAVVPDAHVGGAGVVTHITLVHPLAAALGVCHCGGHKTKPQHLFTTRFNQD